MLHGPRIVLAYGDRFVRGELETRLKLAGFEVVLAATGGEARDLLRQEAACLVLDLQIPGRSALEVLDWMSKDGRSARTGVLGLTVGIDLAQLRSALESGMDDCLREPFDSLVMVERVKRLIAQVERRQNPAAHHASAANRAALEASRAHSLNVF